MKSLYSSPLRVYLCLGALAIAGILAGTILPVSLYPNSSKPTVWVEIPYGNNTADEFLNSYGRELEGQLQSISTGNLQVEKITAQYDASSVEYGLEFKWGAGSQEALREVQNVANAYGSRFPDEIRRGLNVSTWNKSSGFLAISFFSPKRSLDELYKILDPAISPQAQKVEDAQNPGFFNPDQKEIRVELIPEKLALLQLMPSDVEHAIGAMITSFGGGSVMVGTNRMTVQMPRAAQTYQDLPKIMIPTPSGRAVHLSDVALVDLASQSNNSRSFKTSGTSSLILFATPKPGGNVKRMSEELLQVVNKAMPSLPKDIEYKILVDPSEFIRASIHNVMHEVLIGALLAVVVLYFFIGSFKNVVTAAIEIPMSMVLAFILMRMSGMNLNLISLGGLALSAGMNVDASVVVMENIFRHFEGIQGELDYKAKLKIIAKAVAEVRFSVIASTIASLVVFLPLAFTSDLTYAILGDLAKTVVFSHGFSAFVALILVPTVRLQLMTRSKRIEHPHSPIEKHILKVESTYATSLGRFIADRKLKLRVFAGIAVALALLVWQVLPRLPREIIGIPDTDYVTIGVNARGNTQIAQMETMEAEVTERLLQKFGDKINYTFTQINGPNNSWTMARLKNKKDMEFMWKAMEAEFQNTPFLRFNVGPWNPAELPIPNPPQMRIEVKGGDVKRRSEIADAVYQTLQESQVFPRTWVNPDAGKSSTIILKPNLEQWIALRSQSSSILPSDIADLSRVATRGRRVGMMVHDGNNLDVYMRFPESRVSTPEDIESLPIGVGSKIIPLKSLARVSIEETLPTLYREDGRDLYVVEGKQLKGHENEAPAALEKAKLLVAKWKDDQAKTAQAEPAANRDTEPTISFEDAEKELHQALEQLALALGLSIGLIFLVLVIQFGSVVNALLVMIAVPLGFIGVLVALFVFRSTLSLNSVLGVILLNGIAVANSIILVDFINRLHAEGRTPLEAAIEAGRKRLRPILITSLTTILGMLPIALGTGEGGKILQPLGIAVSGGLWVSMLLTLFVVPALQVAYLEALDRRRERKLAAVAATATAQNGLTRGWNESPAPETERVL